MSKAIQKYYEDNKINVVGLLHADIVKNNKKALCHIEYAINNLLSVNGIGRLLVDIANVDKSGFEGERIYYNLLTELHAGGFVHDELKLKILEVESGGSRIFSPYRKKEGKSCDIKATNSIKDYFFEVKDASSEITTSYVRDGITHFTPMDEDAVRSWVINKCKEADEKGASYLICRVPVWKSNPDKTIEEFFYEDWIQDILEIKERLTKHDLIVSLPCQLSEHFEGIYILKPYGHINCKLRY